MSKKERKGHFIERDEFCFTILKRSQRPIEQVNEELWHGGVGYFRQAYSHFKGLCKRWNAPVE